MAKQIPFDLPVANAMSREDFLVTESNRAAMALVDQWPNWPSHGAILVGPTGSGKTHLAAIWRGMANAPSLEASELTVDNVPVVFANGAVVIENLDVSGVSQAALFHVLNLAKQTAGHILLTARRPLADIDFQLPDLQSRLASLPMVRMLQPDDALLRGVLVKQFTDRQIAVDEALISFLVKRIPRSLGTAGELVARIDAEALAEGVDVNRAFASKILAKIVNLELI